MLRIDLPDLSAVWQGMRFAVAGAASAVVSLGTTILLAQGAGLTYEGAFAIGYSLALLAHFTMQRVFVWTHHEEFALPMHHQAIRYVPLALMNYGVVALAIAVLPELLGVETVFVYLAATATTTVLSFVLFRNRVFHPQAAEEEHS